VHQALILSYSRAPDNFDDASRMLSLRLRWHNTRLANNSVFFVVSPRPIIISLHAMCRLKAGFLRILKEALRGDVTVAASWSRQLEGVHVLGGLGLIAERHAEGLLVVDLSRLWLIGLTRGRESMRHWVPTFLRCVRVAHSVQK